MQLTNLLAPNRVVCRASSGSRKQILEQLSEVIVSDGQEINQTEVFESLISREKLGSTGLGKGIAIPHGRLKSGTETFAAFVQLDQGIDYDAPDGEPVDLFFALLVPPESTEEHLQILATLTEMFRDPQLRENLRAAESSEKLFQLLTSWSANDS